MWGALAGRFAGTLVLTTALRAGNELALTRTELPFVLGTAFSTDRTRAKALGYVLHFVAELVFRPHRVWDGRRRLHLAGRLTTPTIAPRAPATT